MSFSRVVDVTNPTGLHARPATRFVELAKTFDSEITIEHEGRSGNAKSIIALLRMSIASGSTVTLLAHGPDEEAAVSSLIGLLAAIEDEPAAVPHKA